MHNNCLNCGTPFKAKRSTKKYCDQNCKQLAYFQRNGMVFGLNGAKQADNVKGFTASPVNVNLYDTVKETVNVKPLNVKDNVKPNKVKQDNFAKEESLPLRLLSDKQLKELTYQITEALNVKLQDAVNNVKQELEVKYASLYGAIELAQNTEPEIPLCNPVPFTGVSKNVNAYEASTVNVKDVTVHNVKPCVKDNTGLTQNTDAETKAVAEHLAIDNNEPDPAEPNEEELEEDEQDYKEIEQDYEKTNQEYENELKELEAQLLALNIPTAEIEEQENESETDNESYSSPEQAFEWVQAKFFGHIEDHREKTEGNLDFSENDPQVNWVNIRLRCIIENVIRLTEYASIDRDTLLKLSEALNKLIKSHAFENLPAEFLFTKTVYELADRLNMLAEEKTGKNIPLRISLKLKAELVSIRNQIMEFTPLIKFHELNFSEPRQINNQLAGNGKRVFNHLNNKSSNWNERYKQYVEAGLIDPEEEDGFNEDDEDEGDED